MILAGYLVLLLSLLAYAERSRSRTERAPRSVVEPISHVRRIP